MDKFIILYQKGLAISINLRHLITIDQPKKYGFFGPFVTRLEMRDHFEIVDNLFIEVMELIKRAQNDQR